MKEPKKKFNRDRGIWPARFSREAALEEANARLCQEPGAMEPAFQRAQLLWELGRTEEAKAAYLDFLSRYPTHFGALNNLGTLLHSTGFKSAARTCYGQAVKCHPGNPMGHVNLANCLLEMDELPLAQQHYESALRLDPDHGEAHQGLANLLLKLGQDQAAARHQQLGFQNKAIITLPYRGQGRPISVLLLVSATRGNVPIRQYLDDQTFEVTVLVAEFYDLDLPLPPHQLIVNSIGDADICQVALDVAGRIISLTSKPVINAPGAVLETGRTTMARRLGRVPGVIAPRMLELPREILAAPEALEVLAGNGFSFPFLLRSPGYNNGQNFYKIESKLDLEAALGALPGEKIIAIQYVDARASDGKIRKYRVMMVDGKLYPLHAAISRQWKIHYITADMADCPENRAEEALFLNNMPKVLGPRAMKALKQIRDILGLDYAGIDFSLSKDGEIILFETNATMIVCPPESDERWAYRQKTFDRIIHALRAMFIGRAANTRNLV